MKNHQIGVNPAVENLNTEVKKMDEKLLIESIYAIARLSYLAGISYQDKFMHNALINILSIHMSIVIANIKGGQDGKGGISNIDLLNLNTEEHKSF